MSGQYRRIYPQRGFIFLDGGLNSKYERSLIGDEESPACQNVIFNNGAVETRQGTSKLNTTSVGTYAGDGLYTRRSNAGSETMCAFWNGTLYTLAGTTFGAVASSVSVFTAGQRVGAAMDEGYLFMGNGGAIPRKWNGAEFTRHGVYPPTTTAAVASNGAGALANSGQYRYKVTFVNSNLVESDVGPATATFVMSTTGGQLRVSSIPVAPQSWGVNTRRLYRTVTSGTTFLRVTTINDNTTTTYDDNNADSALGTTAPTDNGVPPLYSTIIYHPGLGRLFMNDISNPNLVWWTEANNPYTVTSTNFQRVGNNTSDVVKGFAIQDNSIVVFCENSTMIGYFPSNTTSDWQWVVSKSPYGSKSPFAAVKVENKILFPATQNDKLAGFAMFDGDTVDPSATLLTISSVGSYLESDRVETDVFNIQETYIGNISAIVYRNKAYIAATYGSGQTVNNRYYCYDFSISRISKNKRASWVPNTGVYPVQFTVYGGRLYYQDANATGRVYLMESGTYNDDGAAIDSYYWTKEFSGYDNEINFQKDFRYANVMVENSGDYRMNLTYRVDSDSGTGDTQTIDLNPGGSLWGSMVWGSDTWGGGSSQKEVRQFLGTSRGKRIQFRFSNQNTADQKFKVYRMNYAYNLKGFR